LITRNYLQLKKFDAIILFGSTLEKLDIIVDEEFVDIGFYAAEDIAAFDLDDNEAVYVYASFYLNNALVTSKNPRINNGMPATAPITVIVRTIPTIINTIPMAIPIKRPVRLNIKLINPQIRRNGNSNILMASPHFYFKFIFYRQW